MMRRVGAVRRPRGRFTRAGVWGLILGTMLVAVVHPVVAQSGAEDTVAVKQAGDETDRAADSQEADSRELTDPLAPPPEPPQWARHLRRAEIVATGTLPLTLLASRLTYSLVRFAYQSIVAGQPELTYAPWFLAPPGAPELTTGEKLGVIGGAVALSSILAFVDFRLGQREREAGQ